jgi:hypothetical protein
MKADRLAIAICGGADTSALSPLWTSHPGTLADEGSPVVLPLLC